MTHEELIHVLEIVGDAAYRIFSETFKVFADYNKQKNAEIEARDAEIRRLRTMIADHEGSDVPPGEAYKRKPEPEKLTNIEWLYRHPETLVNFLYCPYPGGCIHETELTLDNEDLCRPCMLNWLKEEHKDV